MVSRPTRGTNLRWTASCATTRTVQRARPSSGLLHTIAIKRCFWAIVEHLGGSGARLLIQRPIQTALLITAADVADGLYRQRNYTGNARRGDAFGQLQKCQGAQNIPNLLNPTAEDLGELFLIFL